MWQNRAKNIKQATYALQTTYPDNPCFECGAPSDYHHHVVPRSVGGTKTVPLCARCHGKIHNIPFYMHHSTRIKAGLAKAREEGRIGGRQPVISMSLIKQMYYAIGSGMSKAEACRHFQVKRTTLYDALKRYTELFA